MSAGPPDTRYARSGDVNIAYQVVGDGPFDLVYVPGWVSHVELAWELPDLARGFERLASISRLILFGDKVAGIAVHTGARVSALAGPGEVLVSATVRDLVSGS